MLRWWLSVWQRLSLNQLFLGGVEYEIDSLRQEVAVSNKNSQMWKPYLSQQIQRLVAQQRPRQSIVWIVIKFNLSYKRLSKSWFSTSKSDSLQNAWGEVIESLGGPDKALLVGSQPVAANEHHAILAFESNFNAGQTMKRDNLNTMFGNILSQAAGFHLRF